MAAKSGGSGAGKFVLGFLIGLILVPLAAAAYFHLGAPPVGVADKPFPFEKEIVHIPMHARMDRDAPKSAPFGESEDAFEGGARVYREQCANCHGTPGHDVAFAKHMYPHAPQFWGGAKDHIAKDEVGETEWVVDNGLRLTGMPSFHDTLTDTQRWQVSVLLKNANQPLPDPVEKILTQP